MKNIPTIRKYEEYILLKDIPGLKAGTIFKTSAADPEVIIAQSKKEVKFPKSLVKAEKEFFKRRESSDYDRGYEDAKNDLSYDKKIQYNKGFARGKVTGIKIGREQMKAEMTLESKAKSHTYDNPTHEDSTTDDTIKKFIEERKKVV